MDKDQTAQDTDLALQLRVEPVVKIHLLFKRVILRNRILVHHPEPVIVLGNGVFESGCGGATGTQIL